MGPPFSSLMPRIYAPGGRSRAATRVGLLEDVRRSRTRAKKPCVEDPPRRVPLLARALPVFLQDRVDDALHACVALDFLPIPLAKSRGGLVVHIAAGNRAGVITRTQKNPVKFFKATQLMRIWLRQL